MSLKIALAHDFTCAWCWVGLQQVRKLRQEFDLEIEWRSFEQTPVTMEFTAAMPKHEPLDKPKTPSRFQFLLAADGLTLPLVPKPRNIRTNHAHQAVRYAFREGVDGALIERIYDAFWNDGLDINNPILLKQLATGIVRDISAMTQAIETNQFADEVILFDEPAFESGVYNLPTFFIGNDRYAEQPYQVIRSAVEALAGGNPQPALYSEISYVNPHPDRPFVFINMVSTIDGKIITGERGEPVGDLGSKTDHFLMHRLESKADAILSGANSLRATGTSWNPKTEKRVVVTGSGNIPWESEFMTKGLPIVVTTKNSGIQDRPGITMVRVGEDHLDWEEALQRLKELGIERLNVLGGSEINAQLLTLELVDELFLTLAPKIKLGADTPTYADGKPLPRELIQSYTLVSNFTVGNEIFLRYRK